MQAQSPDEERQREASRLEADNHELRHKLAEQTAKLHETETMSIQSSAEMQRLEA